MNRWVYSTLLYVLSPALLGWMALRARRAGGAWGVWSAPRFGCYRSEKAPLQDATGRVWIHAVSLGETRAALPLIQALLDQGHRVLLTHMTVTGRVEGQRSFQKALESGQLIQQWLPYDFPGSTRRFMRHYQPRVAVLIEREVWPNLVRAARLEKIPLVLASARFSDRSLSASLRAGSVMREAYGAFTAVFAQTLQDAQRLELAGAPAPSVSGNFKFDVHVPQELVDRGRAFKQQLGRPVIAVASTREGEESAFIQAFQHSLSRLSADPTECNPLFLLIPRHPQRFASVAEQLDQSGIRWVRRSTILALGDNSSSALEACRSASVVLGDTLGEMPWYYAVASVAIVGGSFAPLGGQNFIEACAVGTPVIFGPHTFNFTQAALDAIDAGAAVRVGNAHEAIERACAQLKQSQELLRMSEAGKNWVFYHTGSVQRVLAALSNLGGQDTLHGNRS